MLGRKTCIVLYFIHGPPVLSILGLLEYSTLVPEAPRRVEGSVPGPRGGKPWPHAGAVSLRKLLGC